MFGYFLRGATLGLSATTSPGPFQAFLLSQTLKVGWRRTLPTALAPLISDIPIVTLALLVLSQTPGWFLNALQIVGGFFLLYLARGAFLTLKSGAVALELSTNRTDRSFFKAMLMNALSPGPYFFWTILAGPIVLEAWEKSPGLSLSFVVGFYLMLCGGFATFVILFATAGRLGNRVNRILIGVSAVALLVFGLYQLWVGGKALFAFSAE